MITIFEKYNVSFPKRWSWVSANMSSVEMDKIHADWLYKKRHEGLWQNAFIDDEIWAWMHKESKTITIPTFQRVRTPCVTLDTIRDEKIERLWYIIMDKKYTVTCLTTNMDLADYGVIDNIIINESLINHPETTLNNYSTLGLIAVIPIILLILCKVYDLVNKNGLTTTNCTPISNFVDDIIS